VTRQRVASPAVSWCHYACGHRSPSCLMGRAWCGRCRCRAREVDWPSLGVQSSGGPDDFGYTWDDSTPFNWIEATGGAKLQFSGPASGPIDIEFEFNFYENSCAKLYVSRDGLLSFDPAPRPAYDPIPSPTPANNHIAPYMTTLEMSWTGSTLASGVHILHGGKAPTCHLFGTVARHADSGARPIGLRRAHLSSSAL